MGTIAEGSWLLTAAEELRQLFFAHDEVPGSTDFMTAERAGQYYYALLASGQAKCLEGLDAEAQRERLRELALSGVGREITREQEPRKFAITRRFNLALVSIDPPTADMIEDARDHEELARLAFWAVVTELAQLPERSVLEARIRIRAAAASRRRPTRRS